MRCCIYLRVYSFEAMIPNPTYDRNVSCGQSTVPAVLWCMPSKTTHSFSIPPKTMSVPGPLIGGTIVYAIIGAVLMALTFGALVTGKLSKDNAA